MIMREIYIFFIIVNNYNVSSEKFYMQIYIFSYVAYHRPSTRFEGEREEKQDTKFELCHALSIDT